MGVAIAEGDFEGVSDIYLFGTRLMPVGGSEYDIAPLSPADGNLKFLDTPQDLYIVSTSASDNINIVLRTFDADYKEKTTVYTLNGTTPVNIGSWLGVQPVGFPASATEIVGDVYVSTSTSSPPATGTVMGKMLASDQQMSGCYYTVPKGFVAYFFQATPTDSRDLGGANSQYGTLHLFTRDRGVATPPQTGPWRRRGSLTVGTNSSGTQLDFMPPIQFDEGVDVLLKGEGNNDNHRISAYFGLVFRRK
jgi:hypothetical protein